MSRKIISGVHAAVLTWRFSDESINQDLFQKQLLFLLQKGIRKFALNGATGEYYINSALDFKVMLRVMAETLRGRGEFVCGIGSATLRGSLDMGRLAIAAGAKALLLPMPYFFQYSQDDLFEFCDQVATQLPIPILLYNLPQYTPALHIETITDLITRCDNIVGIKDSSGSLDILRNLTDAHIECCRIIGSDHALPSALRDDLCDGVISGTACVLPELLLSLFGSVPHSTEHKAGSKLLSEFVSHINEFPVPWGLKWISEARGIGKQTFAQPVSKSRAAQANDLCNWFRDWERTLPWQIAAQSIPGSLTPLF